MSVAAAVARSAVRSTSTISRHDPRRTSANAQAWPTAPTPTTPTFRPPRSSPPLRCDIGLGTSVAVDDTLAALQVRSAAAEIDDVVARPAVDRGPVGGEREDHVGARAGIDAVGPVAA